mmetsp:Transcript_46413/g.113000  ORF Transcript_46413/g.113000 Transcript_46413/m.113000 type:complete len:258 (+) Transcript_46413:606-1379(+)
MVRRLWSASMAASPSSFVEYLTNPHPLDSPVYLSRSTMQSTTCPNSSNISRTSSLLAVLGIWPTKILTGWPLMSPRSYESLFPCNEVSWARQSSRRFLRAALVMPSWKTSSGCRRASSGPLMSFWRKAGSSSPSPLLCSHETTSSRLQPATWWSRPSLKWSAGPSDMPCICSATPLSPPAPRIASPYCPFGTCCIVGECPPRPRRPAAEPYALSVRGSAGVGLSRPLPPAVPSARRRPLRALAVGEVPHQPQPLPQG